MERSASMKSRLLGPGRKLSRRLSLVLTNHRPGSTSTLQARTARRRAKQNAETGGGPRRIEITLIAPDKTQRNLVGEEGQTVEFLLEPLCREFGLLTPGLSTAAAGGGWPLVRLAGSLAEVNPKADLALLEAEIVIVDPRPILPDRDDWKGVCCEWESSERLYVSRLKSALVLYGSPLSQAGLLAPVELAAIFSPLQTLADNAALAADRMREIIDNSEDLPETIGSVFGEQFWEHYYRYLDFYRSSKQVLREKSRTEEDFDELVILRRGAALFSLEDLLHLPTNSNSRSMTRLDHADFDAGGMVQLHATPLQGSKSLGRLDGIKQVERLSQYEIYLERLVQEARREKCIEDAGLQAALTSAKKGVRRAKEQSDLERIQDLFPNDSLQLHEPEVQTMRMKGLIRKRPNPALRLTRALSAKNLRPESPPPPQPPPTVPRPPRPPPHRHFIMESAVHFTSGVQSQERHLFLFSDLLLIAKSRSGGNFKLKDKVRVSEIWLSTSGLEEVSELVKSRETSFVIGWPTTNVVATFSTQAARDLWLSKLNEVVNIEKSKDPPYTNIQVTYFDQATNIEYVKTLSVSVDQTASEALRAATSALGLVGAGHQHQQVEQGSVPEDISILRTGSYSLWTAARDEQPPYPLIGHERPAAIKLSCLRETLAAEEGFDLDHCNNLHDPLARCHFIIRNVSKNNTDSRLGSSNNGVDKKRLKKSSLVTSSGGRIRQGFGQVFRRSLSKDEGQANNNNNSNNSTTPTSRQPPIGRLFGRPLTSLCSGDSLPPPVLSMLQSVATKGPFTVGMFRKSANVRYVRELRSKLDAGQNVPLESVPILAVGALLKEFLRSLPDPLLSGRLYPRWQAALDSPDLHSRLLRIKGLVDELPRPNRLLLCYVLGALRQIARHSTTNLMSAANLGVCVGPSLLWRLESRCTGSESSSSPTDLRMVPALVEILISHAELILGPGVSSLFGDPRDSGSEESDCLRQTGQPQSAVVLSRDDSSLDSLDCYTSQRGVVHKDTPSGGCGGGTGGTPTNSSTSLRCLEDALMRKDGISLSRDSGLTMSSDSQLYTPEEDLLEDETGEEGGEEVSTTSTSSSGYDPAFDQDAKVAEARLPRTPAPTEYVRVYGGWEERTNPNFQRQAWFRQRSRRLGSTPTTGTTGSGREEGGGCLRSAIHCTASQGDLLRSCGGVGEQQQQQQQTQQQSRTRSEECLDHHTSRVPSLHSPPQPPVVRCEVISEPRRARYRGGGEPSKEDSSTLSDDDKTPQVSRSNSRGRGGGGGGTTEGTTRGAPVGGGRPLRHLPPVHLSGAGGATTTSGRYTSAVGSTSGGRPRRLGDRRSTNTDSSYDQRHRSRSLPPIANRRAPITSYYLPDHMVTNGGDYRNDESYV